MCVKGEGRQATRGALVLCKQSGEGPLVALILLKAGVRGPRKRGGGQAGEEIVHNVGWKLSPVWVGAGLRAAC